MVKYNGVLKKVKHGIPYIYSFLGNVLVYHVIPTKYHGIQCHSMGYPYENIPWYSIVYQRESPDDGSQPTPIKLTSTHNVKVLMMVPSLLPLS